MDTDIILTTASVISFLASGVVALWRKFKRRRRPNQHNSLCVVVPRKGMKTALQSSLHQSLINQYYIYDSFQAVRLSVQSSADADLRNSLEPYFNQHESLVVSSSGAIDPLLYQRYLDISKSHYSRTKALCKRSGKRILALCDSLEEARLLADNKVGSILVYLPSSQCIDALQGSNEVKMLLQRSCSDILSKLKPSDSQPSYYSSLDDLRNSLQRVLA